MRKLIVENARTVVAQADASARDSLQRLADLVEQYRTVEGRKTVVLFSEGFHQRNVSRELEQVAAAAAQSYSVFYAFDLNRRAGTDIAQPLTPSTSAATEALARTEPLGSLAAETDGALILDAASHIDAALARIADQAQDYYIVGFTPSAAARGRARRIPARLGARETARRARQRADRLCRAEVERPDGPPPGDRRGAGRAVRAAGAPRRLHDLRHAIGQRGARACPAVARSGPARPATRAAHRRTSSFSSATCATAASSPAAPTPCRCRPPPPARARTGIGTLPGPLRRPARFLHDAHRRPRAGRPPRQRRPEARRPRPVRARRHRRRRHPGRPSPVRCPCARGRIREDGLTGLLEAYGRAPAAAIAQRDRDDRAARFDRPAERRPARRHGARESQRHHEHRHRRDPPRDVSRCR